MTSPGCGLNACCSITSRDRVGMSANSVARSSFPASQPASSGPGWQGRPSRLHIIIQPPHVTPIFPRVGQPTERRFTGVDLFFAGGEYSVRMSDDARTSSRSEPWKHASWSLPQSSPSRRVTGGAGRNAMHSACTTSAMKREREIDLLKAPGRLSMLSAPVPFARVPEGSAWRALVRGKARFSTR